MDNQKPLPRELFSGAQNDILYLFDGRPCASVDCPPHEDGPNVLATLAGSTQWHIDLCDAIVKAYNDHTRLRAEVDRLTAERQAIESAVTDYAESCEHGGDLPAVVASMAQDLTRLRYTVLTERTIERDEARAEVKLLTAERDRAIAAELRRLAGELSEYGAKTHGFGIAAAELNARAADLDPDTAAVTRVADAIDAVLARGREVLGKEGGA